MSDTAGMAEDARELEFIRDYRVSVRRLWDAVTTQGDIVNWIGPEGVEVVDCEMNLQERGPWMCMMKGRESGELFKVTGVVTHVRPPDEGEGSMGMTWAWHDIETDKRGHESHVIFEVSPHGEGARLRLIHRNLESLEIAKNHSIGWLSTLGKLDRYVAGLS
jgi:uncharacterized protein YndB with AHSA1/START domain